MKGSPKVLAVFSVSRTAGQERLSGIYAYARVHGGWDIQPINEDEFTRRYHTFDLKNADGVICSTRYRIPPQVPVGKVPTVVIANGRREAAKGLSTVSVNNEECVETVAAFLLAKRLLAYAYFGLDDADWNQARARHFAARIAAAGHQAHLFQPNAKSDWAQEKQRLVEWLRSLPKPCGLMAGNDAWARVVLDLAPSVGVKIPEEICLVGVDNELSVCEKTCPTLTSYDPGFADEGYRAAEILDGLMRGTIKRPVHVQSSGRGIVERLSSDWFPKKYICTARAREMIRANTFVDIKGIAAKLNVSRRLLEIRFKEAFGRTMNDEIKATRIEQVKKYLRTTSLPISDICAIIGYQSESHTKRIFREETGISMTEYRSIIMAAPRAPSPRVSG